MQLNIDEFSSILEKKISDFKSSVDLKEVGEVISVGDGIAKIYGLDNVQMGEMIDFESGVRGMALNIEKDNVGAVIFGDSYKVKEGDTSISPVSPESCVCAVRRKWC